MNRSSLFSILFLLPILFFTTGCLQTRQTQADIEARQRALEQQQRRQQLDEYRRGIQMQLEDTETQLANAQLEIRNLRAELNQRPDRADLERMQQQINGLETLLQKLEAQRQQDRDELLNVLSTRMATLINQQQAAAVRSSSRTHVVAAGETLSAIAGAYRVRGEDIIRINNITDPNTLRVGQKLAIPTN